MKQTQKEPEDLTVQLNILVPWRYREQLRRQAAEEGKSFSSFVRGALMKKVPMDKKRRWGVSDEQSTEGERGQG